MKMGYRSRPIQLVKTVWGLRGSEGNLDLTLVSTDPMLMDMDAPVVLPAGSTLRIEPLPVTHPEYYEARDRWIYRERTFR